MATLVATMVVGPLLSIVKDKASSYLLDQYKVMKGMEEQHEILKRKLPAILDIITDAEQAATHREGVAAWLEAIKNVAYQANEVFDEFKYEALRRQAKKKGHYKELGFDVAIEVLVSEMNAFGFKYQTPPPVSSQLRRTGPAIIDPKEIKEIISKSRANDKGAIVSRLVGQANNEDLTVVPIVGMGGLGKTTLAQLVYKEPTIQEHFGLFIWGCVSECFDVHSLAKSIVEAALRKKDDGTEATPRQKNDGTEAVSEKIPLDTLQNVVSGQRYLLVLDDVWERQVHIWDELKACLQHGGRVSVMEKECALATEEPGKIESVVATEEPSQSEWLPNTARHLFLSCKDPGKKLNCSLENSFPAIQTLLCDSYMSSSLQHLSKYTSLQALQLCSHRRSFPLKPKHLHHLRYLDLSRSHIEALPEDISILYNLQTLNLSGCTSLCELPRQMKYMTALRHLYTHGCPELKSMPRDLRMLTSLQTLTCFVVGSGSSCSNVGELGNLNLGGQLELRNLANVTEVDAKAANLVNKELRKLTLTWTSWRDNEEDTRVLENLKPHDGLDAIRIHSYGATTFPTWMTMLQNFVEINLFSCRKLVWLFSGRCDRSFTFPNLKKLKLVSMPCLERWWEIDNDGMQEKRMFPLLEKLCIIGCIKLKAFPGHPTFPNLQNVCIVGCPELKTTVFSPKLGELNVEGREGELFLWVARHMASLENLELHSLEENTETTLAAAEIGLREVVNRKKNGNDHDFFPLAVLVLRNLKSGVAELCACFAHLQDLWISSCAALVHWPEKEFQGLVSLRRLRIQECDNLTGYAQASADPSTSSETSQLLPHLESLAIGSCEKLVELFNVPASLRTMDIYNCSKLESTSGRKLQQGQSVSLIHQGSSSIEALSLYLCDGLTGVLYFPPSLKRISICHCGGLTSLESCSPVVQSLEYLKLVYCNSLSSLPDVPQAYSYLQRLTIKDCHGIKTLPASLQQRLGSLQVERIDAHYYGNKPMLLKPKTWKYVCKG
ncbi:Putative disease resistance protein RGA4 [Triticum urartu]|uniref:Putative disease resistance protein RGA4 n=1 Tax=Triticum urartu TaxID=4572 RepID=M7YF32_TRIUA|nr:Putative disease resistance protein RGA4 [Triticum urartu]